MFFYYTKIIFSFNNMATTTEIKLTFDSELNVPNCPGCGEWCIIAKQDVEQVFKGNSSYSTWFKCPGTCETMQYDTKEEKYDKTKTNELIIFVRQIKHSDQEPRIHLDTDGVMISRPRFKANSMSSAWGKALDAFIELQIYRNEVATERAERLYRSEKRKREALSGESIAREDDEMSKQQKKDIDSDAIEEIRDDVDEVQSQQSSIKKRVDELERLVQELASKNNKRK